jgi:hypothetical protein
MRRKFISSANVNTHHSGVKRPSDKSTRKDQPWLPSWNDTHRMCILDQKADFCHNAMASRRGHTPGANLLMPLGQVKVFRATPVPGTIMDSP